MKPTFGRVLSAMVTPFRSDDSLDLDRAAELAAWLVEEQGHEGLVLAGTTGESPTLTHSEQGELFQAVRSAVSVPIVAGTGSNDTQAAIDLTQRAVRAGVDGVLAVTPYYNRPAQAGIEEYFRAVANAAGSLPVLIYDIPARTGRKVETDTILRLAEVPNIVGVKDAAGDPGETAHLLAQAPGGFEIYSGDDALTLPLLAVGAVATIGVATHWTGREHIEMFDAIARGDLGEAARLNSTLTASFKFASQIDAPNPIPTKAVLRELGFEVGRGRPPMHIEPAGLLAQARSLIEGSGLHVEPLLKS